LSKLFALTGPPRSGKTTVIVKLVEKLKAEGISVGGMTTSELTQAGSRIGFQIADISSGRTGVLAKVGPGGGPKVGKYVVDLEGLEGVGVAAIERAIEASEVIIIDEMGPMELSSKAFVRAAEMALSSGKPIVMTLHWRATHPLLERIRQECRESITTISEANRAGLAAKIEYDILQVLSRR